MKNDSKTFTLYKIYSENCLLYIGRTKQNLQTRLHGHFFKAPMMRSIDIDCVTKIEYATFPTEATLNVYVIFSEARNCLKRIKSFLYKMIQDQIIYAKGW